MFVLLIFDCLLTYIGLKNGFEEDNKIVVFLFGLIGIVPTLISIFILSSFIIFSLYYIRCKYDNEKVIIKFLYFGSFIICCSRAYIVGLWVGLLQTII